MLGTYGLTLNYWVPDVHYQRRKENEELTSSSSHHKTQCCPFWTRLPCPVLTLCHRSASPQVHAAQIRCPPCEKKSTSPVHPYHIKTTMKFNYPLLLLVEIEYFRRCYREAMESTEIRKLTPRPELSWMSSMTKSLHKSSKAANLPTGHLHSRVSLNENLS